MSKYATQQYLHAENITHGIRQMVSDLKELRSLTGPGGCLHAGPQGNPDPNATNSNHHELTPLQVTRLQNARRQEGAYNERLQDEIVYSRRELSRLNKGWHETNEEKLQIGLRLDASAEKVAQLELEACEGRRCLASLKARNCELKNQCRDMRDELENTNGTEQLEHRNASLAEALSKTRIRLDVVSEEGAEVRRHVGKLQNRNSQQVNRIEGLEQTLFCVRESQAGLSRVNARTLEDNATLAHQVHTLGTTVDNLRNLLTRHD